MKKRFISIITIMLILASTASDGRNHSTATGGQHVARDEIVQTG